MNRTLSVLALAPLLAACAGPGLRVSGEPPVLTAVAPTAGGTCVLAADAVWCWGNNAFGELGAGTKDDAPHPAPQPVAGLSEVSGLWGGSHSLCSLASGRLWCWGDYFPGNGLAPAPVDFPATGEVGPVAVGELHACAQVAGRIFCWGLNDFGQLGNDDPRPRATPAAVEPPQSAGALVATWDSTCSLSDGKVLCWGSNRHGKLAKAPEFDFVVSPQETDFGLLQSGVDQIVAGCDSYCVLKDGAVHCWGRNRDCTLGRTTPGSFDAAPASVAGLPADVVQLVPGNGPCPSHLCALTARGELWCWGLNAHGQLGRDPAELRASCSAVRVAGPLEGKTVRLAATGRNHTCAVTGEELWCWGENPKGQLGRDTAGAPTHVPGLAAAPWTR